MKVIKRIGNAEQRKVRDILHKATHSVVQQAKLREEGYDVLVVYGDLNVRRPHIKGKTRCRKNNRKVHTMPSYQIKYMLTYYGKESHAWELMRNTQPNSATNVVL